jgi:hypothetical protein
VNAGQYQNFAVAVYVRAYEVQKMKDPAWLAENWGVIERQVKVDKVYLETHRDLIIIDPETLTKAKAFFAAKGIQTAGGIALVRDERNRFETFCYSTPEHRAKVQEIVEATARAFDEIILDDFFFTNTKSDDDIKAKGDRSWTQYRLDLLGEVSRNLVLKPARAVNPRVKVTSTFRATATIWRSSPKSSTKSIPARRRGIRFIITNICSRIKVSNKSGISRTSLRAATVVDGWIRRIGSTPTATPSNCG